MRSVVHHWSKEEPVRRFEGELAQLEALAAASGVPFGIIIFPELNDC